MQLKKRKLTYGSTDEFISAVENICMQKKKLPGRYSLFLCKPTHQPDGFHQVGNKKYQLG